eukprot:g15062.t1
MNARLGIGNVARKKLVVPASGAPTIALNAVAWTCARFAIVDTSSTSQVERARKSVLMATGRRFWIEPWTLVAHVSFAHGLATSAIRTSIAQSARTLHTSPLLTPAS